MRYEEGTIIFPFAAGCRCLCHMAVQVAQPAAICLAEQADGGSKYGRHSYRITVLLLIVCIFKLFPTGTVATYLLKFPTFFFKFIKNGEKCLPLNGLKATYP